MRFESRCVVVTGGTGELGGEVVKALVEADAVCHVPVRSEESLGRFEMARHGNVHVEVGVDLTDEDSVRAYYGGLPKVWASIHCAGGFAMSPVTETAAADFDRLMSLNARSCFLCCREAVRRMRAAGTGGRIVNVAARPGIDPRSGARMAAYAASKAAVAALTLALAEEVAGDGIWVNAVAPSVLDTPANRKAMPSADHDAWVRPESLASTIVFLASPGCRDSRGAVLSVYGRA